MHVRRAEYLWKPAAGTTAPCHPDVHYGGSWGLLVITGVTGVTGSQIFACPDHNLEAANDGTCLNLHWCCPPMQSPAFFVSVATWHQSRGLSAWPRCAHPTPHVKRLQALRDGKRPVENSCRDTTHIIYQQLHACAFLIPFFESVRP